MKQTNKIIILDKPHYENLLNKYQGAKGMIINETKALLKYYNKKPFEDKERMKWLNCIKEPVIFINTKYKEKEENKELLTTNTTLTTLTTSINNWGYVNLKEKILIEQINKEEYIYNIKGEVGIARIEKVVSEKKYFYYILEINGNTFRLKNNKLKEPLYVTPTKEEVIDFISKEEGQLTEELFNEVDDFLNALFDFRNKEDSKICALFILFSYVLPHFNNSFYLGIDATAGSGKTTLLEILSLLCRHGVLADFSPASIPRLKQKYDLSIFVDEIDALRSKEDIEGLLRKGQRRGNKYVRLNKNSFEEEIFEAFGIYGYSYRSMVEDAFKQRSIIITTAKARDNKLSIINSEKTDILKNVFNKIFFWYVKNLFSLSSKSSEVVKVVADYTPTKINDLRQNLYNSLTKDFTKEEKKVLETFFGRNSEIAFLFIQTCKFLNLNFLNEIKKMITDKQEEEDVPDTYFFDLMREIFEEELRTKREWTLTKGEFIGYKYYPKTKFYIKLIGKLKDNDLLGIGTPRFNSLLKDIGFIDRYNIKNQKPKGENQQALRSLIFSKDIIKKLNIKYSPEIFQEEVEV